MFNETDPGAYRPQRRYGVVGLSDTIITEGGRRFRLWEQGGVTYRTDIGPAGPEVGPAAPALQQQRHFHQQRQRVPRRYSVRRYQEQQRPQRVRSRGGRQSSDYQKRRRPQQVGGRPGPMPPIRVLPAPVEVKPKQVRGPMPPIRVVPPHRLPGPPAPITPDCPANMYPYQGKCIPYPAIRGQQPMNAATVDYREKLRRTAAGLSGLGDLAGLAGCGCEGGSGSSSVGSLAEIPDWVKYGAIGLAAVLVLKKR